MKIRSIESTDLFTGTVHQPRQVVRVTVDETPYARIVIRVEGPTVSTPEPVLISTVPGMETSVEVGVVVAAPAPAGSVHRVTAIAESGLGSDGGVPRAGHAALAGQITAADTGWTMWMVSHFHYDPVWWNTQAGFTQTYYDIPAADQQRPKTTVLSAFDLVRAHLDAARLDPDYKFVLAELDYLKPYWDSCPEDRADLRRFIDEGRVELVGGTYNEPNTNLTHPESTVRNLVYGIGYQRDVLGASPATAWQLDVFGHDPAFPGLCADAGLDSSSWARGPFHMWGPNRHVGDNDRMQFPAEFEWISPSGQGLLTSYMANHYGAGWAMDHQAKTLDEALTVAHNQFRELAPVAATPNVMLPVGGDHVVPSRWVTDIHREWARRYVWPRFTTAIPREYFDAVRAGIPTRKSRTTVLSPQSRDMNPVYTGKDVSYIDTKQGQRAAEIAVLDAERLATVAALGTGHRYPAAQLDKAWRQLVYGAHHDAITGSESDQVYLDLVGGWREAFDLGDSARAAAIDAISQQANTSGPGRPVIVMNTLSFDRAGMVSVTCECDAGGVQVLDDLGAAVPTVIQARRGDCVTLTFRVPHVPALGFRVFRVVAASGSTADATGWREIEGFAVANEAFGVELDPSRGGAASRITDLRSGRELLADGGLGGAFVLQEEYPAHPVWSEGPWHLLPKGPGVSPSRAEVRAFTSPAGQRLVARSQLAGLTVTQEITLWNGEDRVDFASHVDGSIGSDHLLRVRFDVDLPGARPVAEVGFAAIGRSFGYPEADSAEHTWTLETPAHNWAGLSTPVVISLPGGQRHAIGVAEVIGSADSQADVRDLVAALAAQGVTVTSSLPDAPRYGSLDLDSNLPDLRIVIGADNPFAQLVLDSPALAELRAHGRVFVPADRPAAERWVPSTDLRGPRDLPVLVVSDLRELIDDVADAVIDGRAGSTGEPADDYSVALLNRGIPSFVSTPDGSLYLGLMRSCSGWPSGIWLDGEKVVAPDGSSLSWQHWSHTFHYSLVAGEGDWRRAGFTHAGQQYNHQLMARQVAAHDGPLGRSASLGRVSPSSVVLTALKPTGNPLALGSMPDADDQVTVRVYETTGQPTVAEVSLATGISSAQTASVLEDPRSALAGGSVPVGPAGIATIVAATGNSISPAAASEPAQPVFSRYWLHNKGPAPVGNIPVAVHLSPAVVVSGDTVRLTVAAGIEAASGRVTLDVPLGLKAETDDLDYDLGPGEHTEFSVRVTSIDDRPRFLSARIGDSHGQVLEDTVTVGSLDPALTAVFGSGGPVTLEPGSSATLELTVASDAASQVRGEAQLISPFGTWGQDGVTIEPWTSGFSVSPEESTVLRFTVTAPPDARPGAQWWAMVRIGWFGRVLYTPTVPITIAG
jgi:alpha-mannosidase